MATDNTCSHTSKKTGSQDTDHSKEYLERLELSERMSLIKHKIIVLSGKGGVGKSTVAANLAVSLSLNGKHVGLLDVDIHGPSIPRLLNLEGRGLEMTGEKMIPTQLSENLKVISIAFLLPHKDSAVIWRGPMKMIIIKQFLKDVEWGKLDFLIIDSPPGTGDEPLSVCQLIPDADGAIVVTTPQELALADVRKSINFCRQLKLNILGVIENMSGFVCPQCGHVTDIFNSGGAEEMARQMEVPFLGRLPIEPQITQSCDEGTPFIYHYGQTETAKIFETIMQPIMSMQTNEQVSE
ncbi:MAG: Mrp/NBP35 family ATP-binding protein [Sedimentisphaerales bacterium]|nr:Mrp/NBP35 family ATP-binding protein [Sedimentisphaerales bacterium]